MLNIFPTLARNAEGGLDALESAADDWDDDTMRYVNSVVEQSGAIVFGEAYLELSSVKGADAVKKKNGSGKEAVAILGKAGVRRTGAHPRHRHPLQPRRQVAQHRFPVPRGRGQRNRSRATARGEAAPARRTRWPGDHGGTDTGRTGTTYTPIKPPVKIELEDIEKALAFIADVPQGSDFPAPPTRGSGVDPVSLTDLSILIRILIEGLAYAVDLPEGLPFPPRPPAGTQPVSLTHIEQKLDFIMDFEPGEGRKIPPVPPGWNKWWAPAWMSR